MRPTDAQREDDAVIRSSLTEYRRTIVIGLGVYAALGGLSSFLGYVFDIPRLTDWDGNGISIQPNAALCATFSGLALVLLAANFRRRVAVSAMPALLIGAATLLEWMTGISFGHDAFLLFGREWGRVGVVYPGRMGPPGAFSWTLIGLALLLSAMPPVQEHWRRIAPGLALLTVLVSAISLAGYLYGAVLLYTIPTLTVVAMQAATFVMAVSLGIIASHPDREPMRTLVDPGSAGMLARRIVPALLIVAFGLGSLRVLSHDAGLLDIGTGVALHMLTMIALLLVPFWWTLGMLRRREQSETAQAELINSVNNNTSDLIFMKDTKGQLIYANAATLAVTGRDKTEMDFPVPDRNLFAVPSEYDAIANNDRVVRETGETVRVKEIYTTATGERRVYFSTKSPLRDRSGTIVGVIAVSQDITEREHAEEELRKSEAATRAARDYAEATLRTSPVPMLVLESDLRVANANEAFYRRFAVTSEYTEGRMIYDLGNRQWDIPQLRQLLEELLPLRSKVEQFEVAHDFETIGRRTMLLGARRMEIEEGDRERIVLVIEDITERKEAELQIKRVSELLETIIDRSPTGFYIVDADFRISHINADSQARAFRNVRPAIGSRLDDAMRILWPEPLATEIIEIFRRTLNTGEPYKSPGLVSPRADVPWTETYEWQLERITMPDGRYAVVCYYYDTTALRETELKLRESEERFRLIVEGVSDFAIITLDNKGAITGWNLGAEKLLGWTEAEAIGQSGGLIFTPEDRGRGRDAREIEIAHQHGQAENERWHLRKDGSRFWGSGLLMEMKDDSGQARGLVNIMYDRTEARLAEQALRASEERFRGLGEALPLIVSLARPDGTIEYVSPYWQEFSGRSAEDFIRGDWEETIHPDDRDRVLNAWRAALASGQPYEYELRVRNREDEYRWLLARGVPVRDNAGTILHWVNVASDIDERKQAEESLRIVDRRKDEFLATLAHELRNPLAPLRNGLHILQLAGGDAASQEQLVEMMERQVNHLVRLVDDLLEVSRITRGKIELRKQTIELAAVIRNAVEAAQPAIESAAHQLAISLPPTPVLLTADPVRLTQVLANLLSNAAKYTEDGRQIWLTARCEVGEAVISVRDSGMGIPAEMLPRVFDLFTQVDRTLGRAQGGLGIGLALVKSLVRMHDGLIEVKSDGPGQGSEFIVRLPISTTKELPRSAGNPHFDLKRHEGSGQRILVVDDNRDAANSLAMLLKAIGMETQTAYDGASALEAVRTFRPSAVFLDIGMPGMDGYTVASQIRSEPQYQNVTLIALTGWGQEEDKRRAQQAGFDHHLVKPPEAGALQSILGSIREAVRD